MNPNNWPGGMAGGAGRGMPNMNMNMGMAGMPNMGQRQGPNYVAAIYQNLTASQSQDGPFTGWRSHVPIQERAGQVKVLFDSLRMLSHSQDIKRSLDIAIAFERRTFLQSLTNEAYKSQLHEKLSSIRDQRQQNAQVGAMNNMPSNMQMMNPALQQAQQAQMNQLTSNMNFQQPPTMQQSPSFNPTVQQRPMNPNQSVNPNQINQPNRPNPPELTKEDNHWINIRAAEMAKSTARDEMTRIDESMEPRVRQSLQEKKIDPIIYHFRMKATKEFRVMQAHKNAQNQLNNMNRMSTPQQNPGIPTTQPNGTPFMNVGQFQSQQDEGMRSQQEGQLVVPASRPQITDIRQHFVKQIRDANPNATAPELQSMLQTRLRQYQAQMQARQMNSQAGGIPNAGQGQNLTGGVPQPRAVSVLNRPMNQPGQMASPLQNLARPQSRPQPGQPGQPGQSGQPGQPNQPMTQTQPMQGQQFTPEQIMSHWDRLPMPLKNLLQQHPQEMWPKIVMDFRKTAAQHQQQQQARMMQQQQQQQAQQQAQQQVQQSQQQQPPQPSNQLQPQQGANMQRTPSQQPPNMAGNQRMQKMQQNNQFASPAPMQQTLSRGGEQGNSLPNMTPTQRPQQPQATSAQNALLMQQLQQQQQQQQQVQVPPQQMLSNAQQPNMNQTPQNLAFEEALIRETDNSPLPPMMRSQLTQAFPGQNVSTLGTWRQLRELSISLNDQRITPLKIRSMQLSFASRVRESRAAQQAGLNNEGQAMQQQQQPQLTMPGTAQQNSQAARPQLTPQDILVARRQNPNWAPLSDDQVRSLLQQQPKPGNQKQAQASTQAPNIPSSQVQNNTKTPNSQLINPPQPNRPAPQNQNQPSKSAVVAETKNLKRPNQDDTSEHNNVPQAFKFPPPMPKEKFDMMTPADQAQYLQERRKYESVKKVAQLTHEVNSSMKKLPPLTSMDAQARQKITGMLTSDTLRSILSRFDTFLVAFMQTEGDLQMLQTLIQHRWRLTQQFKPETVKNKTFQPADLFTVGPDNLETIINQISTKFHQTLQKSQRQNNNNNATTNGINNAQQQQSIPLTTENLNMAAQQAAQQQKRTQVAKPKDGPPPAPTADKPPFGFPGDRGQGTPKYAASGLKPEDLKLPPKKKQRNDQGASPATPAPSTISKPVLRCTFPECNMQPQGFSSQAELDAHRNTIHKPDMEPVKDPLGFLDNSLQQAFNLDDAFQSKKSSVSAPAMQKSLSRAEGGAPKGNRNGTSSAMARSISQQGTKTSPSNTAQKAVTKTHIQNVTQPTLIDEWQDAAFSFENLNDIFGANETGDVIPMGNDSMSNVQAVANEFMKNNEDWKWNERENHDSSNSSAKSKSPDQGSEPSLPNGEKPIANLYHVDLNVAGTALPILEDNFDALWMEDGNGGERDWTMLDTDGSLSPWEKVDGMEGIAQGQIQQGTDFEMDSWITMPTAFDDTDFPTGDEAMKILEGMPSYE